MPSVVQRLPSKKRQCVRWRPGCWYQVWQSGGVLFLALKMSQDLVDDVLILNATVRRIDDDFDGSTAATANLNKVNQRGASREGALGHVDIEHALESLGPGHSSRIWSLPPASVYESLPIVGRSKQL